MAQQHVTHKPGDAIHESVKVCIKGLAIELLWPWPTYWRDAPVIQYAHTSVRYHHTFFGGKRRSDVVEHRSQETSTLASGALLAYSDLEISVYRGQYPSLACGSAVCSGEWSKIRHVPAS